MRKCNAVEDHAKSGQRRTPRGQRCAKACEGRFASGELRKVGDAPTRARGSSPAVASSGIANVSVGATHASPRGVGPGVISAAAPKQTIVGTRMNILLTSAESRRRFSFLGVPAKAGLRGQSRLSCSCLITSCTGVGWLTLESEQ